MNTLFWTFTVLLAILTIISTIGGGLRYHENFVDEVLDDMYEDVDPIDPALLNTIKSMEVVSEEREYIDPISKSKMPTQPVQSVESVNTVMNTAQFETIIEPFDGNVYSTF